MPHRRRTCKPALKTKQSFPATLYRLLEDAETDPGLYAAIHWTSDNSFVVADEQRLEAQHLSRYFSHSSFPSFQRQAHIYSFAKIASGPLAGSFTHIGFWRSRPELLPHFQRLGDKRTRERMGLTSALSAEGLRLLSQGAGGGHGGNTPMAAMPMRAPAPPAPVMSAPAFAAPAPAPAFPQGAWFEAGPAMDVDAMMPAFEAPSPFARQPAVPQSSVQFSFGVPTPAGAGALTLEPTWASAAAAVSAPAADCYAPPVQPMLQRQSTSIASLDMDALEMAADQLPPVPDIQLTMSRQFSWEAIAA